MSEASNNSNCDEGSKTMQHHDRIDKAPHQDEEQAPTSTTSSLTTSRNENCTTHTNGSKVVATGPQQHRPISLARRERQMISKHRTGTSSGHAKVTNGDNRTPNDSTSNNEDVLDDNNGGGGDCNTNCSNNDSNGNNNNSNKGSKDNKFPNKHYTKGFVYSCVGLAYQSTERLNDGKLPVCMGIAGKYNEIIREAEAENIPQRRQLEQRRERGHLHDPKESIKGIITPGRIDRSLSSSSPLLPPPPLLPPTQSGRESRPVRTRDAEQLHAFYLGMSYNITEAVPSDKKNNKRNTTKNSDDTIATTNNTSSSSSPSATIIATPTTIGKITSKNSKYNHNNDNTMNNEQQQWKPGKSIGMPQLRFGAQFLLSNTSTNENTSQKQEKSNDSSSIGNRKLTFKDRLAGGKKEQQQQQQQHQHQHQDGSNKDPAMSGLERLVRQLTINKHSSKNIRSAYERNEEKAEIINSKKNSKNKEEEEEEEEEEGMDDEINNLRKRMYQVIEQNEIDPETWKRREEEEDKEESDNDEEAMNNKKHFIEEYERRIRLLRQQRQQQQQWRREMLQRQQQELERSQRNDVSIFDKIDFYKIFASAKAITYKTILQMKKNVIIINDEIFRKDFPDRLMKSGIRFVSNFGPAATLLKDSAETFVDLAIRWVKSWGGDDDDDDDDDD